MLLPFLQQMSCLLTIPMALLQNEAHHHTPACDPFWAIWRPAGAAPPQGAAEMRPHVAHSTCAILWRVAPPWCASACGHPGTSSQLCVNLIQKKFVGWDSVLCDAHLRGGERPKAAGLQAHVPLHALV